MEERLLPAGQRAVGAQSAQPGEPSGQIGVARSGKVLRQSDMQSDIAPAGDCAAVSQPADLISGRHRQRGEFSLGRRGRPVVGRSLPLGCSTSIRGCRRCSTRNCVARRPRCRGSPAAVMPGAHQCRRCRGPSRRRSRHRALRNRAFPSTAPRRFPRARRRSWTGPRTSRRCCRRCAARS